MLSGPIELFHGKAVRRGKFQDHQVASWTQNPAHLAQPPVEVLEISDAEGHGDGIESAVGK